MSITNIEEEYTTVVGIALVILHKNSVLTHSGQNLDNPSRAVNGIVKHKNRSRIARCDIRISLVSSPGRGCFGIRLFWKYMGLSFQRLFLWKKYRATKSKALLRNDDKVKVVYKMIKSQCQGSCMLWFERYKLFRSQSISMAMKFSEFNGKGLNVV